MRSDRVAGAARRSRLYAAARLAQRRGAGGLLLRLRQRRAVAAVPHRLRAADVPRAATGSTIRAVNQRFADAVVTEATQRRSDRARAGLPLRAAAAHDARNDLPQGDHRHLLAHSLAERGDLRHLPLARGDPRRACSAAPSSASTPSSTATTSSRRSTASWRAASTASSASVTTAARRP